ncbi:hypothetical protein DUNSADRAFT_148 [Dunaliella salina]|nr:hypothetical protein DUNSADRAFT_148 [Dunaliella salina]|eukprot:KAF5827743.1 hypothetical protein DUNSADRAFT_148 [Dunaliella salina]
MLEKLLEGCLGNSLPSPGYANEGSKPAPAINTDGRAVDGLQPHPQQQTASDQHRSSHTTTQHVLLSSTPRHPERHQHQFTGTQSMLSMPWTQRRNPQNQHLHQHRHHAANAAQVEWAGSLRCMPDPESNEVSIQGLLQGRGWAPEMKDAARRAAVSAQKERRSWEAHVGMSWRGRTHQAGVLNAGLGAKEGEVLKGQGHEEDHTPLKGEEGLGLADSGGMVLPQQQKQQQRQQQSGEQRSPVEGEGSKVKVRDKAAQQGLVGSSGGAPSKQARQGQQHQYQRQRQRTQEGLGEDEALALGIAPKERKRRERDLGREERMRADLKQAEQELVMACTQEGRTAALFLACTLREELARLSRHNMYYKKLLETRKHSARANTRDPVFGIKHVVGRQHPPETALPIAYDCHGYPRYAHEVLQAAYPSSKSGDAGDADARLGVGAGKGKHGAASGGGLPEDGIVNATGLKPAVRAPAQQQQQQQQQQQGARKSSTAAAKGHASSGDTSSDDGHSDGRASPDLTPNNHPHRNFPASLAEKAEHHPSHQQSSTSASREWGPGHPHTNYPRAPRHLQHPHFISDPCYAASPDPHYHPVLYPPGRLSSSFDPHHNLTHYQTYAHRYRHRKHHHQHAPPAAVAPQAQPQRLGTNYLGADDYSEAPPWQHRYQSRAAAAAEAAVARLRDPFGYGTPNQMRDLAWTQIHPATPDPLLMADQVPFKPQASKTSVSRPGAINDVDPQRAWEDLFSGVLQGYSQGARAKKDQDWAEAVAAWLCKSQRERVQESKQLRAMPIDDFKLQLRKEREWQRAVGEVQSLLLADGGDRGHTNLEADEVHKDTQNPKGGE